MVDGERTKRSPFVGSEAGAGGRAGAVPFVSFPANAPLARNAGYRVVQFFRPGVSVSKRGETNTEWFVLTVRASISAQVRAFHAAQEPRFPALKPASI